MEIYIHLCFSERKKIEKLLNKKESVRKIAIVLCRSVSCISNEIKLGKVNGIYNAKKAEAKARLRRKNSKYQCLKVVKDTKLKEFVIEGIEDDQSPEGISGRLKEQQKDISYASTKAIYKFVESPYGRQIEKHLYSNSVRKKGGPKNKKSVCIDGRTMIDKRPKKINKRTQFGHFEADFIESGKDGKGSLLVIVERKTRYPILQYLEDRKTKNVNYLISNLLKDIPIKSLTIDNDISFQKHKELSELIHSPIFFCHPSNPQEKGTVENRNKAIRRYVKKRSDLSSFLLEHFKMVEEKLRNKFMKCLNFKTPKEAFEFEMKKLKLKKPQQCGSMSRVLEIN